MKAIFVSTVSVSAKPASCSWVLCKIDFSNVLMI